jgi:hypothetical protein
VTERVEHAVIGEDVIRGDEIVESDVDCAHDGVCFGSESMDAGVRIPFL